MVVRLCILATKALLGSVVEEDVDTLEEKGGTSELDKTDSTLLSED